jgi:hypothetical protein
MLQAAKAAVEGIIELDPVAICIRKLVAQRVAVGRELPRIFCVSLPILRVTIFGKEAQAGSKILAPSPVGCGALKRFFACWGLN